MSMSASCLYTGVQPNLVRDTWWAGVEIRRSNAVYLPIPANELVLSQPDIV